MAKKKLFTTGGIVYSTSPDFNPVNEEEFEETVPAAQQLLKIRLDAKHRGGKIVSIVSGFLMPEKDIENMARQLKSFCGTGGSAKDQEIIIQGDHREKMLQWLIKNGYTKSKKV